MYRRFWFHSFYWPLQPHTLFIKRTDRSRSAYRHLAREWGLTCERLCKMVMLTDRTDRAAIRFYEQSRGNGSHHELALRIATAAWRKSYPEATEAEAAAAVRCAVQSAYEATKPRR